MPRIVRITSKGQATLPKELRDKFGIKKKAIVVESEEGILFKPLPSPSTEMGSLSTLLSDNTVKELMTEARTHEKAE